ncbi:unnamed protein product [Cyclocybe aegerita]|uniref:Ubiquinone biosynthesis protein n=1 Tax=Cyclocybe aegerita TaxID=1973307 RepID=A0A8S0W447_CYCAE|nr:unnamed protein product [Cyclocybe aegerita]
MNAFVQVISFDKIGFRVFHTRFGNLRQVTAFALRPKFQPQQPSIMSASSSTRLLRLALPLVQTHGFTREALAHSVLYLPPNEAHGEPLSDTAVSALFGHGDAARRALIDAWLEDGLVHMRTVRKVERDGKLATDGASGSAPTEGSGRSPTLREVLRARLEYNEPVVSLLPEAFALLVTPSSGIHLLDPLPAFKHAATIADEACSVTGDRSLQLEWYARRASLATVYVAAELHQLTSPTTAYAFLDSLLETSSNLKSSLNEVELYSSYVFKSWRGIIKSSGIFS